MYSKRFMDFLAKLILAAVMSFSLVYPLTTTLLFSYTASDVIVLISILLLIYSVLFTNKLVAKFTIPLALGALVLGSLFLVFTSRLYYVIDPVIWLNKYINGNAGLVDSYTFIVTLFFSIALSLIVYIFTIKKFSFTIIALSGVSIFVTQWMFNYFVEKAYVSFYTFIVSVLAYYFMHIYNKKSLQDSNDFANPSGFILGIAPICILVFLLTNSIPVSSKPIEWKWMDEKINFAYNHFQSHKQSTNSKTFEAGYFSLTSTGFGGENSTLGGDVRLDDTKVLEVVSDRNIYLRGRASDSYTGSSWDNTSTVILNLSGGSPSGSRQRIGGFLLEGDNGFIYYNDSSNNYNKMDFDIFEMKKGLPVLINQSGMSDSDISDFSESDSIISNIITKDRVNIRFLDIRTKSLFIPLKSESFVFPPNENDAIGIDQDGIFSSNKALQRDFKYSFDNYNIKLHSEDFKNLLKQSERGLYDWKLDRLTNEIYDMFYKDNLLNIVDQCYKEHGVRVWNSSNEVALKNIIRNSPDKYVLGDELIMYLSDYFFRELNLPGYSDEDFSIYFLKTVGKLRETDFIEELNNFKTLSTYSNEVYSRYLQIPGVVPSRVKDLALSITRDHASDFEKSKAIERYLASNYTYTLTPGNTPEGRDFVDYFLFDQKEGYCVYYASSMVILARSIGLPARYVEGYILPPQPARGKAYEVTNQQAHAWAEIYFEGFGWITFEPTSPFESALYNTGSYGPDMSDLYPESDEMREYMENLNGYDRNRPDMYPVQNQNIKIDLASLLTVILLAALSLILILAVVNITRRMLKLKHILKMPPKEGVIALYESYLKFLLYQRMPVKAGETPLEYAKRLDDYGHFYPHKFSPIAEVFMKARYSRKEVTQNDRSTVYTFYRQMVSKTRKSLGPIRYFFQVFILGRI